MKDCETVRGAPVSKGASREAEFTEFVEAASASLLRAALVLLDTREEAEDALQLALLRTFRRWDRAKQAPEAYSRAVLVNVCRERWRHRKRHPEVAGKLSDVGPLAEVVSFAEAVDRRHVLVRVLRRPRQRRRPQPAGRHRSASRLLPDGACGAASAPGRR